MGSHVSVSAFDGHDLVAVERDGVRVEVLVLRNAPRAEPMAAAEDVGELAVRLVAAVRPGDQHGSNCYQVMVQSVRGG